MTGPVSRRDVLATSALTAVAATSGCLLDNQESTSGQLYAENTTSQDVRLLLWVGEDSEGTPNEVIAGAYDVPASHALEFEGIVQSNRQYTVRAALPESSPPDRVSVTIDECSGEPTTERAVSVRTRTDGLGIIPWGCEDSYTRRELEYVAASEYRVDDTIEGTIAGTPDDTVVSEG